MKFLKGAFICLLLAFPPLLHAQEADGGSTDMDALRAADEFRLGVLAYNRYAFNEAILSFERALSYRPGEERILDWLGRAYYRSGMDGAALRQWQAAARIFDRFSPEALLLGSRIETISNSRNLLPVADDDIPYVESGRYPGTYGGNTLFRQPSAVLPLADGSVWVVAYGSNEVVRIDVNGLVRARLRGPLNGFDRPYDLARGQGGRFYLSELRGSRISVLNQRGEWQAYIGSRGRGDGNLLGPQNLAVDDEGYLWVVDYGNMRVSKFDPDGLFILNISGNTPFFGGFRSPTGIACKEGRIYVADQAARRIYMFDSNGSYEGSLDVEGLLGPESLRFLSDGRLLAVDANRILLIDTDSALMRVLGMVGGEGARITGADMDGNGNILAANFQGGEVSVLTRMDDMASGLFVQIQRVSAENFPQVTVEIQVQDRLRRPIVGLDAVNFLLSEEGVAVPAQTFYTPPDRLPDADISILLERSPAMLPFRDDLPGAVNDIQGGLPDGSRIVSLISAGIQPVQERIEPPGNAVRGNGASYDPRWRFDMGLRLAATGLLSGAKKRAVVFISSGEMGELAFEQYSLSELAAYLSNNGIIFDAVLLGNRPAPGELSYLCAETGGQILPLYRPEGIREMIQSIALKPNGIYIIGYQSRLPSDFGRAYLPVETEVYLMERSGRDRTGYFPPLE
ncbi:MAG: 6-bladed beta-propeller [Treponema sp.]|jgi:DNA-binding beta-propeller fold protein YncE|nr:6-bladed beta-propeller [Treponema sp.]